MLKNMVSGILIGALAFSVVPAHAKSVSEQIELCAEAIDAEELANVSDYRVKFIRVSGGAAKKLKVELIPNAEGDVLEAECKIRRGKVQEVALTT